MPQFAIDPQQTETSGRNHSDRQAELAGQHWNRARSQALAREEGVEFSNGHWDVVMFLRRHYLEHGLPITARVTAKALRNHFTKRGGNKYLYRLFPGGPVTQGSRLANVRTPACATDPSFGTRY